jgi:hypothetical protein
MRRGASYALTSYRITVVPPALHGEVVRGADARPLTADEAQGHGQPLQLGGRQRPQRHVPSTQRYADCGIDLSAVREPSTTPVASPEAKSRVEAKRAAVETDDDTA